MPTRYVPRVFGGTLIITTGPPVPPRVLSIKFVAPKQHINVSLTTPKQHLKMSFAMPKQHINLKFAAPKQHIKLAFSEVAMTAPNTTVDSSATLTDQNGNLISSVSASSLTVTYPDGTTATPSVTNMGSGVYTATYATKGPGFLTELWSFTDTSGAVAQEQRMLAIAY